MTTEKERIISNGDQAAEDLKILEEANLDEIERMPTWNVIDSLRYIQRLCNRKNMSVHDITPELIIEELHKPKIYL